MGRRDTFEPPYPQTRDEVEHYCARLIDTLLHVIGDRLVCVLLCGSWARAEARPPMSDTDITVIVDVVDERMLQLLKQAWITAQMGYSDIYSLRDVATMSTVALEMYTTNAITLWGINPFPQPVKADFAEDAAQNIETVARYARHLAVCYWRTSEEIALKVPYLVNDLRRLMQNMVAFRTGLFPKNKQHFVGSLGGSEDLQLLNWLESLDKEDYTSHQEAIAERVNRYVNNCASEIEPFRKQVRTTIANLQLEPPAG